MTPQAKAQPSARKVLVTGGAGFIGSHIVDALVARGEHVVVLDDLSTGKVENISAHLDSGRIELAKMDLATGIAQSFVADLAPDLVFHLAAQKSVGLSVADPLEDARININGLLRLLEGLREAKQRTGFAAKVVFASSGGTVYSPEAALPTHETAATDPVSPYGVAKLASEKYLGVYGRQHGLRWTALRLANVYGPRQDPKGEAGVVAIFAERALRGEPLRINGDGKQTRDYVFVEDVARAFLAASEEADAQCINIGTGAETNVTQVAETMLRAANSMSVVVHGPARAGEQRRSCLDASLSARLIAWYADTELGAGITRTVESFKQIATV